MQLEIRGQDFPVFVDLRDHIQSRMETALARHRERVERVEVRLADVNGPKGGVDKQCRAVVRLRPRGRVMVQEVSTDFLAAATRVADRLSRAVARSLERQRESRINRQGMSPREEHRPEIPDAEPEEE